VALAGGLLFLRLGITNPFFLGPLLCVSLATMAEMPTSPIPQPLTAIAQIAIGVALGAMFDRRTVIAAAHFIGPSLLIGGLLLLLAFALAGIMSAWLGESFAMLVLANAPGGTPEMAVTAASMSLDASLVAAFHLVRILIILPLAAVIFRVYRSVGTAVSPALAVKRMWGGSTSPRPTVPFKAEATRAQAPSRQQKGASATDERRRQGTVGCLEALPPRILPVRKKALAPRPGYRAG
jgi:membrane AbrB-like protein